jgi:hypothetical protein
MIGAKLIKRAHGGNSMDQSIVEDLVTPSHILANEGVLGHISVRHPDNPQHYLMSPSRTGSGAASGHHGI